MSLLALRPHPRYLLETEQDAGAASASAGASVAAGTSDYGAWVSMYSALEADAHGIWVAVQNLYTVGSVTNAVARIGVDPAGGSSYTTVLDGLLCGGASIISTSLIVTPFRYFFPLFIPKGASVAGAIYANLTDTGRMLGSLVQRPEAPIHPYAAGTLEKIGLSGYAGTVVAAGDSVDGAWTSLGTTSGNRHWWQVGVQADTSDSTITSQVVECDLAFGDASTKVPILNCVLFGTTSNETVGHATEMTQMCARAVPAGSTIYARLRCNGTPDAYQVVAYGFG